MALVKCPRCELNYMNEGEKMCSVCRKELHGESEQYDVIELCSECGEHVDIAYVETCDEYHAKYCPNCGAEVVG